MSVGAEIPPPLHLSEEEQRQEGYGFPVLLQFCQVSRRAAQLHRYTCPGYTCKRGRGEGGRWRGEGEGDGGGRYVYYRVQSWIRQGDKELQGARNRFLQREGEVGGREGRSLIIQGDEGLDFDLHNLESCCSSALCAW